MQLSSFSLAAILSSATAFTVHPINNLGISSRQHKSTRSDQGWDNSNFLESLNGGQSSIDKANQQYQNESETRAAWRERRLQSMNRDGMDDGTSALFGAEVPGMPTKLPKAPEHDEENPMGGEMFRKMMEKAKNGPNRPRSSEEAYPPSAAMGATPQFAASAAPAAAPVSPAVSAEQMAYYQQQLQAWQQQMTAFAQFSAANPEAAASLTMPPPPPPPAGLLGGAPATPAAPVAPVVDPTLPKADLTSDPATVNPHDYVPKGSGNKDAYEITNPADVYFAQLKRDSQVRQSARLQGNMEVANKPFEDVGVKALNNYLSKELIAQRRKQLSENGGEFETSRDEMILPYEEDEEETDVSYTGVSYKQKLLEMKKAKEAKKGGQAVAAAVAVPEPVVESKPSPEPEPSPSASIPEPQAEVVNEDAEEKPNFALATSEDFDDTPIAAPSMEDSEESRQSIRTLMGLLLKHRGGPGFGAGRLKEDDFAKLTDTLNKVTATLQAEAGMEVSAPVAYESHSPASTAPMSPLAGSIACAEAALQLYKTADASSQSELLAPVRDALESALKTLSHEIEGSSKSVSDAVPSSAPVYATTMDFPDTYKVTQPEEDEQVNAATSDVDENTAILQNVYDTLKSFAGEEKYGLRQINANEVTHIKDILHDMRGVIMDELDNGIPN